MAKIRGIENGEGEFAFFICQIRHFAMTPSDPVTVKLDTVADRKTRQSITQVKNCRRKLVMCYCCNEVTCTYLYIYLS